MGEDLPLIAQVSNVSALATLDQMEKLFGFMGKIKDIRMYPSVSVVQPQFKVCFIKYAESWSVRVALHMTNTVFIDRALVVVAIPGDSIPPEDSTSFDLLNPASALPALLSGFKDVSNDIAAVDGNLVITSVDTNLDILGLPQYPPLSADQDPNTIEEIRRTIYIENINPQVTASQLMDFMNNIVGEVKYLRMAGLDKNMLQSAFVEFTDRASIVKALQCDGITLKGNILKINHSSSAIVKPTKETEVISEKDTEEAMKRLKEAESLIARVVEPEISGGKSSRSRRRSTSRSRRRSSSRTRRRSRSVSRRSSKRDKRSRSKEKRRRSTSRRRKTRSRSRSKLRRSRSRSRPRRSRSRSKGRRSKRAERSYSRSRRSRSKGSDSKSKSSKKPKRSRSRSPRTRRRRSRSRSTAATSKRSRRSRSRSARSRSKSRLSKSQRSRSRSRQGHSRRSKRSTSKSRASPKRERSRSHSKMSSSGKKDVNSKPKTSLSSSRSRSRDPSPTAVSAEEVVKASENLDSNLVNIELTNSVAVTSSPSQLPDDSCSKPDFDKDEPSQDTINEISPEKVNEILKPSDPDDTSNMNPEIPLENRSPTGESQTSDKEGDLLDIKITPKEEKPKSRSRSPSKGRSSKSNHRSPKKLRSRSKERKRTRSPVRNIRRRRSYSSSDSSSPEVSRVRDKKSRSRHHSRSPRRSKRSSRRSVTPPKRAKRSPTPRRSKRSITPSSSKYRSRDDKRKSRSRKRSTSRSLTRHSKSRSPHRSTTKEPGSDKEASSRASSSKKETPSALRARKGSESDARGSDSDV